MERKHSRNAAHVHVWDDYGRQVRTGLSHVECDVNTSDDATTGRMQVCSSLHFVRVYVRRVIYVIVHSGLSDVGSVLVVVRAFSWPFVVVVCSWISVSGGVVFTILLRPFCGLFINLTMCE